MSDLSSVKILNVTETHLEVFIQHYNYIEPDLNPELQTNENIRNATLYAFLVDFALYYTAPNYEEKYFEMAFFEEDGIKYKFSGNFYDEEEASKIIDKVEILEWHYNTPFTKELFEKCQNVAIKTMFEEEQKHKLVFGHPFNWDEFLEQLPRNYFTAKVYFKDKKYLIGFEKDMKASTTLNTSVCGWMG